MSRERLIKLINERAVLRGEFTLRSGRKSNYYIDKYLFETDPEILGLLAEIMADMLPGADEYDLLAGPELGAVPLVTALSLRVLKPFVIVRKGKKGYGTDKAFEGKMAPGQRVVLVEDVLTTAGAALEAAEKLQDAGAGLLYILGVIDRQEGARENIEARGLKMKAVLTKTDLEL